MNLKSGDPGSGGDGLRVGHARRETLPRRSHHRDLRGNQRDPEAGDRGADSEGVPAVNDHDSKRTNNPSCDIRRLRVQGQL